MWIHQLHINAMMFGEQFKEHYRIRAFSVDKIFNTWEPFFRWNQNNFQSF